MKQIVLERTSTRRPSGSPLRPGPDGTVSVRKPGPTAPANGIPCLTCKNLRPQEPKLGYPRVVCLLGHFTNSRGFLRLFSPHELQYPSREMLATANACTDHQPNDTEA